MDDSRSDQQKAMEQLQTIKTFFEEGQKNLHESGFLFMFWGILIPGATLVFYYLADIFGFGHPLVASFWPAVSFAGSLVSWIVGSRSGKRSRTKGYALKINSLMWIGFLISILILFLVQFMGKAEVSPAFLSYIALLLGLAYWIHGSMIQLAWFRFVSVVWWITAVMIAGRDWFTASILLAGATFLCSFIPGLILYRTQDHRNK